MAKRNVGWAMVIIGLFMLFKMVRVSSFGFYRIGGVSTSAIVLVILIISAIAVVNKKICMAVFRNVAMSVGIDWRRRHGKKEKLA